MVSNAKWENKKTLNKKTDEEIKDIPVTKRPRKKRGLHSIKHSVFEKTFVENEKNTGLYQLFTDPEEIFTNKKKGQRKSSMPQRKKKTKLKQSKKFEICTSNEKTVNKKKGKIQPSQAKKKTKQNKKMKQKISKDLVAGKEGQPEEQTDPSEKISLDKDPDPNEDSESSIEIMRDASFISSPRKPEKYLKFVKKYQHKANKRNHSPRPASTRPYSPKLKQRKLKIANLANLDDKEDIVSDNDWSDSEFTTTLTGTVNQTSKVNTQGNSSIPFHTNYKPGAILNSTAAVNHQYDGLEFSQDFSSISSLHDDNGEVAFDHKTSGETTPGKQIKKSALKNILKKLNEVNILKPPSSTLLFDTVIADVSLPDLSSIHNTFVCKEGIKTDDQQLEEKIINIDRQDKEDIAAPNDIDVTLKPSSPVIVPPPDQHKQLTPQNNRKKAVTSTPTKSPSAKQETVTFGVSSISEPVYDSDELVPARGSSREINSDEFYQSFEFEQVDVPKIDEMPVEPNCKPQDNDEVQAPTNSAEPYQINVGKAKSFVTVTHHGMKLRKRTKEHLDKNSNKALSRISNKYPGKSFRLVKHLGKQSKIDCSRSSSKRFGKGPKVFNWRPSKHKHSSKDLCSGANEGLSKSINVDQSGNHNKQLSKSSTIDLFGSLSKDLGRSPIEDLIKTPSEDLIKTPGKDLSSSPGNNLGKTPGKDLSLNSKNLTSQCSGKEPSECSSKYLIKNLSKSYSKSSSKNLSRNPIMEISTSPCKDLTRNPRNDTRKTNSKNFTKSRIKSLNKSLKETLGKKAINQCIKMRKVVKTSSNILLYNSLCHKLSKVHHTDLIKNIGETSSDSLECSKNYGKNISQNLIKDLGKTIDQDSTFSKNISENILLDLIQNHDSALSDNPDVIDETILSTILDKPAKDPSQTQSMEPRLNPSKYPDHQQSQNQSKEHARNQRKDSSQNQSKALGQSFCNTISTSFNKSKGKNLIKKNVVTMVTLKSERKKHSTKTKLNKAAPKASNRCSPTNIKNIYVPPCIILRSADKFPPRNNLLMKQTSVKTGKVFYRKMKNCPPDILCKVLPPPDGICDENKSSMYYFKKKKIATTFQTKG
ncbi:uncharacterized protein LOC126821075 [Patella vulgata]|uniref:uncharacterized protein LOC126821075 n=1 Tax=Patella vulgata TaxID=6465 RepID=UPI00217FFB0B|nr:uncharacterized protein LOC126821075 [Patella vulgata]